MGELTHRLASAAEAWSVYEEGFGPIRMTSQALDAEGRSKLKAAFENCVNGFSTDLGVALTYQYLVTVCDIRRGCLPRPELEVKQTQSARMRTWGLNVGLYEPVGVKVVLSRGAFLALHVLGPYCRGQVRR